MQVTPTVTDAQRVDAIVMGASAGGMHVLSTILPQLPETLPFPIFLVEHQKPTGHHYLSALLNGLCPLTVVEAEDKMPIRPSHLYVAPPDYHLLIESPHHMALSVDEPVHFCRPSVDILFESAAAVFKSHVTGIILTGMGHDGAQGLLEIHQTGGLCAVQDPASAAYTSMPESALKHVPDAQLFFPETFGDWFIKMGNYSAHP